MALVTKTRSEVDSSKESFVDVYHPIAGWKARQMVWDDESGIWVPWATGYFAYQTYEEAAQDARHWAEMDEVVFVE